MYPCVNLGCTFLMGQDCGLRQAAAPKDPSLGWDLLPCRNFHSTPFTGSIWETNCCFHAMERINPRSYGVFLAFRCKGNVQVYFYAQIGKRGVSIIGLLISSFTLAAMIIILSSCTSSCYWLILAASLLPELFDGWSEKIHHHFFGTRHEAPLPPACFAVLQKEHLRIALCNFMLLALFSLHFLLKVISNEIP